MSKFKNTAEQNAKISAQNKKLVKEWGRGGIKQSAMLTPKIDKDNWAIIDNSIIGIPFQIPFACMNSINSHCQPHGDVAKTVEDCKELCKKDPLCQIGNFITMKDKTYCIPYAHTTGNSKNMSDAVWNLYGNYQNKNIKSSSFLDYNKYSPWNPLDYSIFFQDLLAIQVSNKKKYFGVQENNLAGVLNTETTLQLIDPGSLTSAVGENNVRNYFNVMINIYGTYLVIQQKLHSRHSGDTDKFQYTDRLEWFSGLGSLQNAANQCTLICLDKQPGELLDYDDEFVIIIGDKYICIDNQNDMFVKSYDFLHKNSQYSYKFIFKPKFPVSYCNNTSELNLKKLSKNEKPNNKKWAEKFRCQGISIDQCIRENNNFYYVDPNTKTKHIVYGGGSCYDLCRDNGSVEYTNRIPLITPNVNRTIIIDQLVIAISIIIISYAIFMLFQ